MAKIFLLIGGYPRSLLNFRGQFLRTLVTNGLEVHAAAPDLPHTSELRHQLEAFGVKVHEFALKRTGMNPAERFDDIFLAMVFNA